MSGTIDPTGAHTMNETSALPWVTAVEAINRLLALMNGSTYVDTSKEVH